jgi:hypothetical protein
MPNFARSRTLAEPEAGKAEAAAVPTTALQAGRPLKAEDRVSSLVREACERAEAKTTGRKRWGYARD